MLIKCAFALACILSTMVSYAISSKYLYSNEEEFQSKYNLKNSHKYPNNNEKNKDDSRDLLKLNKINKFYQYYKAVSSFQIVSVLF
jgi:hypothetical protein